MSVLFFCVHGQMNLGEARDKSRDLFNDAKSFQIRQDMKKGYNTLAKAF